MVLRVATLSAISLLSLCSSMAGDSIAPDPFSGGGFAGDSLTGGFADAGWPNCDFGGELPTPVLAYNFNSVDRVQSLRNYHYTSSKADPLSPIEAHEISCSTALAPFCGTYETSGGPDASGSPGSRYYNLGSGDGTAHRGFEKTSDAAEEDYSTGNAFTISVWIKLDGKSSAGTIFASKATEFIFGGNPNSGVPDSTPYDTKVCGDVTGATDTTNCDLDAGTDMAPSASAWTADGAWHHWVFKYDGGTEYEIWLDSVSVYTQSLSGGTIGNSSSMLKLGAISTWGFDGGYDEFAIFDTALADADIITMGSCLIPE